jgi:DNA-binding MarR family transcriptional regulator
MNLEELMENFIDNFIDQVKFFYYPDQWNDFFIDYSKNEIFTLFFLYKNKETNVSQIAEYINAPLNTITGVVNRLVKKGVAQRIRSAEDRRIVLLTLTEQGKELVDQEKKLLLKYMSKLNEVLTEEEKKVLMSIFNKVQQVFLSKNTEEDTEKETKPKIRRIEIE